MPAVCGLNAEAGDNSVCPLRQVSGPDEVQASSWASAEDDCPDCRQGILAGAVLAFARALGEYGATSMIAGYTPGKTATIATTVYQLWRTNDEAGAMRWVLVDIVISAVVLLAVNLLEKKQKAGGRA